MLVLPHVFKLGLLWEDVEDDIPATVNGEWECCIVEGWWGALSDTNTVYKKSSCLVRPWVPTTYAQPPFLLPSLIFRRALALLPHSLLFTMDEPVTKRLIISGLTPSITAEDISRRLTTFGTVKAADGFGLPDGLGNPRSFGYVTLETTVGKLAKCEHIIVLHLNGRKLIKSDCCKGMNLLSGSTWKGAKLRFGEAKPDFKERYV